MLLAVTFAATIALVYCCNSTPSTNYNHKHVSHADILVDVIRPKQELAQRSLRTVSTISTHLQSSFISKTVCGRVRPGLQHVTFGLNRNYFQQNFTDISPPMSHLFQLSCLYSTTDDLGYQKPDQLDTIRSTPKGLYQEYSKSFRHFHELMAKEETMMGFWTSYVHNSDSVVAIADKDVDNIETTIISYVRHEYITKLFGNIQPSENAKRAYDALPQNYNGNENEYLRFIYHYGSEYFTNAVMGGRFFLCLNHHRIEMENKNPNLSKQITDLSNTIADLIASVVKKTQTTVISQYVLHEGGSLNFNQNLGDWSKSVAFNPYPIGGTLAPIPFFFNETKGSPKYLAFMKAKKDEEMFHNYKKILIQMKRREDSDTYMGKALIKLLHNEMSLVQPSQKVYDVISNRMKLKASFASHFFECQKPYKKQSEYDYQQERQQYSLAKDICVTVLKGLPHCKDTIWQLPDDVKCLLVFKNAKCSGNIAVVAEPAKLSPVLPGALSYYATNDC